MIVEIERVVTLAETALSGPEQDKPDALFDLIKVFAEMPPAGRGDCADAVFEKIYPLTRHFRESLEERIKIAC